MERRNLITQKCVDVKCCDVCFSLSSIRHASQRYTLLMTHVSANVMKNELAFLNCLFNPFTNTFYYISSKIIWKEERGAALLPRGLNSASTICQEQSDCVTVGG